jgi:hypothetical protein
MHRTQLTTIVATLSLMAAPGVAVGAGPSNNHPTGSKAKAYGTYCKDESKKHVAGQSGTPFSQCVTAMAKLDSGNPTSACKALSKKHVAGQPGTPFSQCVKAAAKLKKAQATDPSTTDRSKTPDPAPAQAASPPADPAVCNEAQNSPRGTEDATTSTDPLPPARHKSTAMPVGHGNGLTNAATNSPALAVCVPQTPPADGGDGTSTGTT